jgi:peptidoglycan hydrolase-like protein with peptidoglycan-binding domain
MSEQAAKAGRWPPRLRPRALALALAAGVVAAVVALLALSGVFDSAAGADDDQPGTATATVARRDLVQRSTVSGTLGSGDTRAIVTYRLGTLTNLPEEGRVLRRGAVLYGVDERPIVLFFGSQPAWRPLALGVGDGRDVRQLEQNLRALGYGEGLTVDRRFTASTVGAVVRWRNDVGLPATGRVELGDIVFLPGARRVGTVTPSLGDPARPGARIMATSSTERLVTAEIDAGDQQDIAARARLSDCSTRTSGGSWSTHGSVSRRVLVLSARAVSLRGVRPSLLARQRVREGAARIGARRALVRTLGARRSTGLA